MKAKLTNSGILLTAQTVDENTTLERMYQEGHVHLCCKALSRKPKRNTLLLTPSIIKWKRNGIL